MRLMLINKGKLRFVVQEVLQLEQEFFLILFAKNTKMWVVKIEIIASFDSGINSPANLSFVRKKNRFHFSVYG